MNRLLLPLLPLAALGALVLSGCGAAEPESRAAAPSCPAAWRVGWQKLADRIDAPVYCPRWLPSPLTGEIGGPRTTVNSVGKDRSYLIGFAWKDREDEVHVNLRGYPGKTAIPTCRQVDINAGKKVERSVPCFADSRGRKRVPGIEATVYTVSQDADRWHISYLWRHDGSLYVLSEHVAPPLTYRMVVRNLDRMLRTLVLVAPHTS
jgi:hypothetical protein